MTLVRPLLAPACLAEGVGEGGATGAIWQARFDRMSGLAAGPAAFARPSAATYWSHQGLLAQAGPDAAVFAHDPAGHPLGLACMAARTNHLLHGRDLSQAVWSKASVSAVRNATGIDGVANSASTVTEAATDTRGAIDQAVSVADDTAAHTATVHIARDAITTRYPLIQFDLVGGGTVSEQFWLDTTSGATVAVVSGGSHRVEASGDWWRVVATLTNNASGNTSARLRLRPANGSTIGVLDNTAVGAIVVDAVQIHVGTERAAGAPILTGATAVTRAADALEVDLAGRLPAAFGFEVCWDADGGEEQFARVLEFNDGTTDNLIALIRAGDQAQFNVVSGGALVVNVNIGAWSAGRHRAVARVAADDFAIAMDGAVPVHEASGAVPALDRLLLGHASGASWLDNTIASAGVWHWAPSDDALRALSARR